MKHYIYQVDAIFRTSLKLKDLFIFESHADYRFKIYEKCTFYFDFNNFLLILKDQLLCKNYLEQQAVNVYFFLVFFVVVA